MIDFTFSELSKKLSAAHIGAEVTFRFINRDSRTIKPGEVYIALKGENFDGHDFIKQAQDKGAIAAIVSKSIDTSLPLLKVADTRLALGKIATLRRNNLDLPVVAITGSCGKTTTKSLLAAILSQCGETLATQGTLNNDIGVPVTLLHLTEQHQYAVIELGANHPGEIAYITHLTRPTIAIITNVAPVHLEGFKDLAGIASGKGEIFEGLARKGVAIINADDSYAQYWLSLTQNLKVLTFGLTSPATIFATDIYFDEQQLPHFNLNTPTGKIDIQLNLLGQHNILNALAAAAAAVELNVSLAKIKAGLQSVRSVDKRLTKRLGINNAQIIDDSYNANPAAFKMALEVLAQNNGEKILIIGDMGELGEQAEFYHAQVGNMARQYGIAQLYAVGKLSEHAVKAFGVGASHYPTQAALISAIKPQLNAKMTILIKGSRSARMENIVAAFMADS